MAWIRTIDADAATGRLKQIYDAALARAGRVFGILRVQSLDPAILDASLGLYFATTTHPRSPLPRWFRELIAARVSALNDCFY
jgi:alkylhydroperoxidase family enzyme